MIIQVYLGDAIRLGKFTLEGQHESSATPSKSATRMVSRITDREPKSYCRFMSLAVANEK